MFINLNHQNNNAVFHNRLIIDIATYVTLTIAFFIVAITVLAHILNNNIVIENLKIMHYKGNAIMGQAGNNFEIRNNLIVDTGVYGIFPQLGQNGIVEGNIISGIEDAAIYIGMSDNVHVTHNEVFDSVAGIEIEMPVDVEAETVVFRRSCAGMISVNTRVP